MSGALPVASVIASASSISAAARGELSGMHVDAGAVGGRDRKNGERAGIASEPKLAGRQLMPRLVLPQIGRDAARQARASGCRPRVWPSSSDTAAQRSPERGHACRIALGEAGRQTVQEQVDCRGAAPERRGAARAASATSSTPRAAAQAAGEDRRCQRFEVRLAREPGVQRFEALRRPEQQRRSVAAAAAGRRRAARAAAPAEHAAARRAAPLRRRPAAQSAVGRTGLVLGLRRGQRHAGHGAPAPGSASRPARGTRPRRRARRVLCARSGRALELRGDVLVRRERRVGQVPGAAIGIERRDRSLPPEPDARSRRSSAEAAR